MNIISICEGWKNKKRTFTNYIQTNVYSHPVVEKMKNLVHLRIYQNRRIFLDEYPEQEELRKNWFEKNHDIFKHIYTRFLKRN